MLIAQKININKVYCLNFPRPFSQIEAIHTIRTPTP